MQEPSWYSPGSGIFCTGGTSISSLPVFSSSPVICHSASVWYFSNYRGRQQSPKWSSKLQCNPLLSYITYTEEKKILTVLIAPHSKTYKPSVSGPKHLLPFWPMHTSCWSLALIQTYHYIQHAIFFASDSLRVSSTVLPNFRWTSPALRPSSSALLSWPFLPLLLSPVHGSTKASVPPALSSEPCVSSHGRNVCMTRLLGE